jgi:peptidoglycan hydrolase-like protein with peptidoglycan-binding domain
LDLSSGDIWTVKVYDSQGRKISFYDNGRVYFTKKEGSRGSTLLGIWTWDGTKPVIPSMDITNSTKAAAGFAKNQDDILKNNKILGVGSRNDLVKIVQEELYSYYYDEIKNTKSLPNPGCTLDADENPICDGVYGQKTKQLVSKYQEDNGLNKDGFVGNETYRSLF